jgi:WD40 repeat protein
MRNIAHIRDGLVAVGGKGGMLSLWDIASSKLLRRSQHLTNDVVWVQVSFDGSLLVGGDLTGYLVLLDIVKDRVIYSHKFATDQGIEASFFPNQHDFVVACENDLFTYISSTLTKIGRHGDYPIHIATTYDGKRLIVGDNIGEISVYKLDKFKLINRIQVSSYPIQFVGSGSDAQAIVIDGEHINIFDVDEISTKPILEQGSSDSNYVTSIDIMTKQNRLAACTTTGVLLVSDYRKNTMLQKYIVDSGRVYTGVTFTNIASKFALSDYYGNPTVYSVKDNTAIHLSSEE